MGVIRGRIIHNDDFQITDRLFLHGRNRATYEMVRIEGGDNDGNLHPPALAENNRFSTIGFFYQMLSEVIATHAIANPTLPLRYFLLSPLL
jgi:hypothetical protein